MFAFSHKLQKYAHYLRHVCHLQIENRLNNFHRILHCQIKAVNKFKYLGSILEATGATTLEIENRISEGRRVIGMLNSVLWSKTMLHKTKKLTYQALVKSILLYGKESGH
jgi:hypothetical protein